MLTVCRLIATAAYTRTEIARRALPHSTTPTRDDAHWRLHLLWRRGETPTRADRGTCQSGSSLIWLP